MAKVYLKWIIISIFLFVIIFIFYVDGVESKENVNIPLKDGEAIKVVYRKNQG